MGLGVTELLLILAAIVLIFGLGKLPKVGGDLAAGIKAFRANLRDAPEPGPPPASPTPPPERLGGPSG